MLYKFHFTFLHLYEPAVEGDIDVDLTDDEVQLIQRNVDSTSDLRIDQQIRRRLKKIYKKIIAAGYPFCQCAVCRNIRSEEMGNDISWDPVDYEALLQEDIQRGFVPHDEDGHPYIKEELTRQWIKWENEMLSHKSHLEQLKYYEDRYHFAVDGVLDKHIGKLQFTLPAAIDVTGPTDNWWQRHFRWLQKK